MDNQPTRSVKEPQNVLNSLKRYKFFIVAGFALIVIGLYIFILNKPERSITSFCKVASEQKNNFKGGSNKDILLNAFKKLDAVAPESINTDTTMIVKGYEIMINDPSKSMSTGFGITSSQLKVSDYIKNNCPNY